MKDGWTSLSISLSQRDKKMKIKVLFAVSLAILVSAFLMSKPKRADKNETEPPRHEWHDHGKAVAYQAEFQRGYLAFVKQFSGEFDEEVFAADLNSFPQIVERYTSEDFQEESDGYADGYHRAGERAMQYRCTRNQ